MYQENYNAKDLEPSLEKVQEHFRQWRSKKERSKEVPIELWEEAVSLLKHHSPSHIHHALGLNYKKLKGAAEQMQKDHPARLGTPALAPTFVETRVEEIMGLGCIAEGNWRLVVERADGSKLMIQPPSFDDHRMRSTIKDFVGV